MIRRKQQKLKTIWFYDEVYKRNILFCIGDANQTLKYLHKQYNIDVDFSGNEAAKTFDYMNEGYGVIIWLESFNNSPETWGYLVHELSHATMYILAHAGIVTEVIEDEPFAYYMEFLTRRFVAEHRKKYR
jgi:hypothetical protein